MGLATLLEKNQIENAIAKHRFNTKDYINWVQDQYPVKMTQAELISDTLTVPLDAVDNTYYLTIDSEALKKYSKVCFVDKNDNVIAHLQANDGNCELAVRDKNHIIDINCIYEGDNLSIRSPGEIRLSGTIDTKQSIQLDCKSCCIQDIESQDGDEIHHDYTSIHASKMVIRSEMDTTLQDKVLIKTDEQLYFTGKHFNNKATLNTHECILAVEKFTNEGHLTADIDITGFTLAFDNKKNATIKTNNLLSLATYEYSDAGETESHIFNLQTRQASFSGNLKTHKEAQILADGDVTFEKDCFLKNQGNFEVNCDGDIHFASTMNHQNILGTKENTVNKLQFSSHKTLNILGQINAENSDVTLVAKDNLNINGVLTADKKSDLKMESDNIEINDRIFNFNTVKSTGVTKQIKISKPVTVAKEILLNAENLIVDSVLESEKTIHLHSNNITNTENGKILATQSTEIIGDTLNNFGDILSKDKLYCGVNYLTYNSGNMFAKTLGIDTGLYTNFGNIGGEKEFVINSFLSTSAGVTYAGNYKNNSLIDIPLGLHLTQLPDIDDLFSKNSLQQCCDVLARNVMPKLHQAYTLISQACSWLPSIDTLKNPGKTFSNLANIWVGATTQLKEMAANLNENSVTSIPLYKVIRGITQAKDVAFSLKNKYQQVSETVALTSNQYQKLPSLKSLGETVNNSILDIKTTFEKEHLQGLANRSKEYAKSVKQQVGEHLKQASHEVKPEKIAQGVVTALTPGYSADSLLHIAGGSTIAAHSAIRSLEMHNLSYHAALSSLSIEAKVLKNAGGLCAVGDVSLSGKHFKNESLVVSPTKVQVSYNQVELASQISMPMEHWQINADKCSVEGKQKLKSSEVKTKDFFCEKDSELEISKSKLVAENQFKQLPDSKLYVEDSTLSAKDIYFNSKTSLTRSNAKAENTVIANGELTGDKANFEGNTVNLTHANLSEGEIKAKDKLELTDAKTSNTALEGKNVNLVQTDLAGGLVKATDKLELDYTDTKNTSFEGNNINLKKSNLNGGQVEAKDKLELTDAKTSNTTLEGKFVNLVQADLAGGQVKAKDKLELNHSNTTNTSFKGNDIDLMKSNLTGGQVDAKDKLELTDAKASDTTFEGNNVKLSQTALNGGAIRAKDKLALTHTNTLGTNLEGNSINLEHTDLTGGHVKATDKLGLNNAKTTNADLEGGHVNLTRTDLSGGQVYAKNKLDAAHTKSTDTLFEGNNINLAQANLNGGQVKAKDKLALTHARTSGTSLEGNKIDIAQTDLIGGQVKAKNELDIAHANTLNTALTAKNMDLKDSTFKASKLVISNKQLQQNKAMTNQNSDKNQQGELANNQIQASDKIHTQRVIFDDIMINSNNADLEETKVLHSTVSTTETLTGSKVHAEHSLLTGKNVALKTQTTLKGAQVRAQNKIDQSGELIGYIATLEGKTVNLIRANLTAGQVKATDKLELTHAKSSGTAFEGNNINFEQSDLTGGQVKAKDKLTLNHAKTTNTVLEGNNVNLTQTNLGGGQVNAKNKLEATDAKASGTALEGQNISLAQTDLTGGQVKAKDKLTLNHAKTTNTALEGNNVNLTQTNLSGGQVNAKNKLEATDAKASGTALEGQNISLAQTDLTGGQVKAKDKLTLNHAKTTNTALEGNNVNLTQTNLSGGQVNAKNKLEATDAKASGTALEGHNISLAQTDLTGGQVKAKDKLTLNHAKTTNTALEGNNVNLTQTNLGGGQVNAKNKLEATDAKASGTALEGHNISLAQTDLTGGQVKAKDKLTLNHAKTTNTALEGNNVNLTQTNLGGGQVNAKNKLEATDAKASGTALEGHNINLAQTDLTGGQVKAKDKLTLNHAKTTNTALEGNNVNLTQTNLGGGQVNAKNKLEATDAKASGTALEGQNINLAQTDLTGAEVKAKDKLTLNHAKTTNTALEGNNVNLTQTNLGGGQVNAKNKLEATDAKASGTALEGHNISLAQTDLTGGQVKAKDKLELTDTKTSGSALEGSHINLARTGLSGGQVNAKNTLDVTQTKSVGTLLEGKNVNLTNSDLMGGHIKSNDKLAITHTHTLDTALAARDMDLKDSTFKASRPEKLEDASKIATSNLENKTSNSKEPEALAHNRINATDSISTERVIFDGMVISAKTIELQESKILHSTIHTTENLNADKSQVESSLLTSKDINLKTNTTLKNAEIKAENKLEQSGKLDAEQSKLEGDTVNLIQVNLSASQVKAKEKLSINNGVTSNTTVEGNHVNLTQTDLTASQVKAKDKLELNKVKSSSSILEGNHVTLVQADLTNSQAKAKDKLEATYTNTSDTILEGNDVNLSQASLKGGQVKAQNALEITHTKTLDTAIAAKNMDLKDSTFKASHPEKSEPQHKSNTLTRAHDETIRSKDSKINEQVELANNQIKASDKINAERVVFDGMLVNTHTMTVTESKVIHSNINAAGHIHGKNITAEKSEIQGQHIVLEQQSNIKSSEIKSSDIFELAGKINAEDATIISKNLTIDAKIDSKKHLSVHVEDQLKTTKESEIDAQTLGVAAHVFEHNGKIKTSGESEAESSESESQVNEKKEKSPGFFLLSDRVYNWGDLDVHGGSQFKINQAFVNLNHIASDNCTVNSAVFANILGNFTANNLHVNAGIYANVAGHVAGYDNLTVNAIGSLNVGIMRSMHHKSSAAISYNLGLYLPSLPSSNDTLYSWDTAFSVGKTLLYNVSPMMGSAAGTAMAVYKLKDAGKNAKNILSGMASMGTQFFRDPKSINIGEAVCLVVGAVDLIEGVNDVVSNANDTYNHGNKIYSSGNKTKENNSNGLSPTNNINSSSENNKNKPDQNTIWKNIQTTSALAGAAYLDKVGPSISSDAIYNHNQGGMYSRNISQGSIWSVNSGIQWAQNSYSSTMLYQTNSGEISAENVSVKACQSLPLKFIPGINENQFVNNNEVNATNFTGEIANSENYGAMSSVNFKLKGKSYSESGYTYAQSSDVDLNNWHQNDGFTQFDSGSMKLKNLVASGGGMQLSDMKVKIEDNLDINKNSQISLNNSSAQANNATIKGELNATNNSEIVINQGLISGTTQLEKSAMTSDKLQVEQSGQVNVNDQSKLIANKAEIAGTLNAKKALTVAILEEVKITGTMNLEKSTMDAGKLQVEQSGQVNVNDESKLIANKAEIAGTLNAKKALTVAILEEVKITGTMNLEKSTMDAGKLQVEQSGQVNVNDESKLIANKAEIAGTLNAKKDSTVAILEEVKITGTTNLEKSTMEAGKLQVEQTGQVNVNDQSKLIANKAEIAGMLNAKKDSTVAILEEVKITGTTNLEKSTMEAGKLQVEQTGQVNVNDQSKLIANKAEIAGTLNAKKALTVAILEEVKITGTMNLEKSTMDAGKLQVEQSGQVNVNDESKLIANKAEIAGTLNAKKDSTVAILEEVKITGTTNLEKSTMEAGKLQVEQTGQVNVNDQK